MPEHPTTTALAAYAATLEVLAQAITGRHRRSPDGTVLAFTGSPRPALNAIISPTPCPDPATVEDLATTARGWDTSWTLQVPGEPDARTAATAAAYGLTARSTLPLMIRTADQGIPEPLTGRLRIDSVLPDQVERFVQAVQAGFEVDSAGLRFLATPAVLALPGITYHFARLNGEVVGTGLTARHGDHLGIYNLATLPAHRRRGHGRAVTLELCRLGYAAGARTAYLFASPMGLPIYRDAGFRTQAQLTLLAAP